jgi:F-type H+-transporting ATPase subunit epsilon
MLPQNLQVEIVSPDKLLYSGTATFVSVPGKDGCLGILPGHAPLLSELQAGEIIIRQGEEIRKYFCREGFVEVLPHQVSVLAQVAEKPEEIDVARAQKAKDRAWNRLQSKSTDLDYARACAALQRALIRIQIATPSK